jgi:transposase
MPTIPELNKLLIAQSKQKLKEIPFSKITVKLTAISALENNSILKVAQVFSVQRNTIKSWIRNFNNNGIEGLELKAKKPRKSKLNDKQIKFLQELIKTNNGNFTLLKIQKIIKEKYKIEISHNGVWKLLKRLNYSHITARPTHYKQDKEKLEYFKKNSNRNQKRKSK